MSCLWKAVLPSPCDWSRLDLRSHVQGLAASAEEEELVKEAQTFIVEHAGSVLLIVDDVAEPEEIEQLLPKHKASNLPAAHVLMTGHREQQDWPEAMQLTGRARCG